MWNWSERQETRAEKFRGCEDHQRQARRWPYGSDRIARAEKETQHDTNCTEGCKMIEKRFSEREDAFFRNLCIPEEDRHRYTSSPWDGSFRFFKSRQCDMPGALPSIVGGSGAAGDQAGSIVVITLI
jgi:hypothetical protein